MGKPVPPRRLMGGSIQGKDVPLFGYQAAACVQTMCRGKFNFPTGIATDGVSLYVADADLHVIKRVDISSGFSSILAGDIGVSGSLDGIGTDARFFNPSQITTDGYSLFVADTGNSTIRRIGINSQKVKTIAGIAERKGHNDGKGSDALFWEPTGITTDLRNIFVTDKYTNVVRKMYIPMSNGETIVETIAGQISESPGCLDGIGLSAKFNNPSQLTTDGKHLFISDEGNNSIRKLDITNNLVSTMFRFNSTPRCITTDGKIFFYCSANSTISGIYENINVSEFSGKAGEFGGDDGQGLNARFSSPLSLTTDGDNVYVADNNGIRKIYLCDLM